MEKKKVVTFDTEARDMVDDAYVISVNENGEGIVTCHGRKPIREYYDYISSDETSHYGPIIGWEYKEGWYIYSASPKQVTKLMTKDPASSSFKKALQEVLENKIELPRSDTELGKAYRTILKKDFKLAKQEIDKRNAYLSNELEKTKEAEKIKEKAKEDENNRKAAGILQFFKSFSSDRKL